MFNQCRGLMSLLLVGALVGSLAGQERGLGGSPDAKETPPPPGVDQLYWNLTKVKDRSIKAAAERYVGLVRTQEWSDASGKFKTLARYVKHDPTLTSVTIEIIRGRGAEQTKEQKTVPVDKLSKLCQTRVRQIDAAQKNLKEWAAAHPDQVSGVPGGAGPMPQDSGTGAPMTDESGASPPPTAGPPAVGPEGVALPAAPSPPPTTEPDPSASDPDPLGFAELPPAPGAPPSGEAPPNAEPPPGN
jgi:hypothetical protein